MFSIVDGGGGALGRQMVFETSRSPVVCGIGGCSRLLTGGGGVRLADKWYFKLVVLRLFAASARVHCFLISRATEWPEVQMSQR